MRFHLPIQRRPELRREDNCLSELIEYEGVDNNLGNANENPAINQGSLNQSEHSGSINAGDIQQRYAELVKNFDEAVKTSKKLGVIHHESDNAVVNRLVQLNIEEHNNRFCLKSIKRSAFNIMLLDKDVFHWLQLDLVLNKDKSKKSDKRDASYKVKFSNEDCQENFWFFTLNLHCH
ncbi:hypothetical protein RHGRI_021248 [Rhododendron griersonianum]|uniref:Uncharacterized protein n=1 Tax=Rhododendron griersonianum TaxID=479676 RepID=A0AAV6JJT0_9ERIC|nr:hypothetical protein RHGRI_021248 [Rhododendron griersonianum]